jgi:hypothetical protein
MFRYFKTKTTFKEKSTAIKILLRMKDIHQDNFNQLEDIAVKQFLRWGHVFANSGTDIITDEEQLTSLLAKSISDCIDYNKYVALSAIEKNQIRELIAKKLYEGTKELPCRFTVFVWDYSMVGWPGTGSDYVIDEEYFVGKGITNSYEVNEFMEVVSKEDGKKHSPISIVAVNFPDELFTDKLAMQQCIHEALSQQFSFLLFEKKGENMGSRINTCDSSSPGMGFVML